MTVWQAVLIMSPLFAVCAVLAWSERRRRPRPRPDLRRMADQAATRDALARVSTERPYF